MLSLILNIHKIVDIAGIQFVWTAIYFSRLFDQVRNWHRGSVTEMSWVGEVGQKGGEGGDAEIGGVSKVVIKICSQPVDT